MQICLFSFIKFTLSRFLLCNWQQTCRLQLGGQAWPTISCMFLSFHEIQEQRLLICMYSAAHEIKIKSNCNHLESCLPVARKWEHLFWQRYLLLTWVVRITTLTLQGPDWTAHTHRQLQTHSELLGCWATSPWHSYRSFPGRISDKSFVPHTSRFMFRMYCMPPGNKTFLDLMWRCWLSPMTWEHIKICM